MRRQQSSSISLLKSATLCHEFDTILFSVTYVRNLLKLLSTNQGALVNATYVDSKERKRELCVSLTLAF